MRQDYYSSNAVKFDEDYWEQKRQEEIHKRIQKKIEKSRKRKKFVINIDFLMYPKANTVSRKYLIFLTAACVATVFLSIFYLQAKSDTSILIRNKALAISELKDIRTENDDYENNIKANIDLTKIKQVAVVKLGMRYPEQNQIVRYQKESRNFFRQYMEVPVGN